MEKLYELIYGEYTGGTMEREDYTVLARATSKEELIEIAAKYGLRPSKKPIYGEVLFIQAVPMIDTRELKEVAEDIRTQVELDMITQGRSSDAKYLIDSPKIDKISKKKDAYDYEFRLYLYSKDGHIEVMTAPAPGYRWGDDYVASYSYESACAAADKFKTFEDLPVEVQELALAIDAYKVELSFDKYLKVGPCPNPIARESYKVLPVEK